MQNSILEEVVCDQIPIETRQDGIENCDKVYYSLVGISCSEDSDFTLKSEEMYHFFDKHGWSCFCNLNAQAGHHHTQQIDQR